MKVRLLKFFTNNSGYLVVSLYKGPKKMKKFFVHRLVAITFIKNPKFKRTINHIDANKHNNSISNLEWATYKENAKHARERGLTRNHGEQQKTSKLKEKEVLKIRQLYANGVSILILAKEYRVCFQNIHHIVTRKTWKHL